jgi:large subunit ribosomal protein L15
LYRTLPKIGFNNVNHRDLQVVNIGKIQEFIIMGRLKPEPNKLITIRDLVECGLVSNIKDGVKLLARV